MAIKKIDARIQNKADFLSNWQAGNIELLPGEIAFVKVIDEKINPDTGEITHIPAVLLKVGEADDNGNPKAFDVLPWLSAKASDVYDWAKKPEKPTYTLEELGAEAVGATETHNSDSLAHSDIRALIEALSERLDNLSSNGTTSGGTGVQSDWDETDETSLAYIKNKPFYTKGWSIEWDGTPTEEFIDVTDTMGAVIYKVGEAKTEEDLIGVTCKYILDETEEVTFTIARDNIVGILDENGNETDKGFIIFDGYLGILSVCLEPGTYYYSGLEFTFESTATYFVKASNYTPIYLGNTEIKKIDKNLIPDIFVKSDLVGVADGVASLNSEGKVPLEQLPDNLGGGITEVSWEDVKDKPFYEEGFAIVWDGDTTGKTTVRATEGVIFTKVYDTPFSDITTFVGEQMGLTNEGNLMSMTIESEYIETLSDNIDVILFEGEFAILNVLATDTLTDIFDEPVTFEAGVYFLGMFADSTDTQAMVYVSKLGNHIIKQLDPKFIPNYFGETGFKIEWDGTPTDVYETFDAGGALGYFYKVAEPVDTIIDGVVYLVSMEGNSEQPISSDIVQVTDGGENGIYIMNVKVPNSVFAHPAGVDITFREVGLYFFCANMDGQEARITSFVSSDYGIKKIDEKYIPDIVIKSWNDLEDKPFSESKSSITWDGTPTSEFVNIDGLDFYKVSDTYTDAKSLIGSTVSLFAIETGDTITEVISSDSIIDLGENCFYISSVEIDGIPPVIITSSAISRDGIDIPSAGIWFLSVPDSVYTCCLESVQIKKLDPKFIPNYFGETGTKITWDGKPTDTFVQPGKIIEWDGTDTGVSLTIPSDGENIPEGVTLYKVAEKLDSLEGWSFLCTYSNGDYGASEPLCADNIGSVLDDNGDVIATYGTSDTMWVWNVEQSAPVPIMGMEVTFPEPGLYFISIEGQFRVSAIYNEAYDSAGPMAWYKISEPWNGTLYGAKMSVSSVEGETMEMIFADGDGDDGYIPVTTLPSGSSYAGPYVLNIVDNNETIDLTDFLGCSLTFPEAGLYAIDFNIASEGYMTFDYLISADYNVVKIDKKFLPEDVGGSGGVPVYVGQVLGTGDDSEGPDAIVVNYGKALSAGSLEELYTNMCYDDIIAQEFILECVPLYTSGKGPVKLLGIASAVVDGVDNVVCNTYIELNKTQELDAANLYRIYCIQNPENPKQYAGYIFDGLAEEVLENLNVAVTSGAVYDYIDNLGLNPEDLVDTKTKANTQADWSVNDSSSVAYVQNRLVYNESFQPDIRLASKPSSFDSFGSGEIWSTPCHYKWLANIYYNKSAIEIANNVASITFGGIKYYSYKFKILGDDSCAIIKHTDLSATDPLIVVRCSRYASGEFDGFSIPSSHSEGIWGITAIDDAEYPDRFVSEVIFKTFPHQLPVEYIPTDEEVTQGSTNLISSGAVHNALASIEDNLQFDSAPTLDSEKLVKSGGIATALNLKVDNTTLDTKVSELNTEIGKKASQTDLNATNTKIDTQVNNLTTEINKKANQSDVTASVNSLTAEINKKADSESVYTKSEIDGLITGVFYYKGSVETFAKLPTTAAVGDTYNVKTADVENNVKAGDNVVWCETDGVGHWDVLSGIVDLSAYSTSEEIQTKLDEKADKAELSTVARSNDYLDLDNKPCFYIGLDLTAQGKFSDAFTAENKFCNVYYYVKSAEFDSSKTVQDYIDGFVSATWFIGVKQSVLTSSWSVDENGIARYGSGTYPYILIIPEDGLVFTVGSTSKKFDKGIYCQFEEGIGTASDRHVGTVIFQKKYTPLDINYLPTHNHVVSEISDIQTTLSPYAKTADVNAALENKVDVDPTARLMTNAEGNKLAGIASGANKYVLPAATTTSLGGVKVGENLSISEDGTISATSLAWDNVEGKPELYTKTEVYNKTEIDSIQTNLSNTINSTKTTLTTLVNGKVDKVTGSRLMTEIEGEKLASLNAAVATSNRYDELDGVPCKLTGVDATFTFNRGSLTDPAIVKISELPDTFHTLAEYRNSFKYFISAEGEKILPTNSKFVYKTNDSNTVAAYFYDEAIYSQVCFVVLQGSSSITFKYSNSGYSRTEDFEEPGIYINLNSSSSYYASKYISEIKFEGQYTKLKSEYLLAATATTLGGVKVGENLSISEDGTISATSLNWNNVKGKPETFTPSTHNHDALYYTESEIDTKVSLLQTNINSVNTNLQTAKSDLEASISATKSDLQASINTTKSDLESSVNSLLSTKQDKSNLVTSIESTATDTQYPSAKAVYGVMSGLESTFTESKNALEADLETKQDKANLVTTIDENSTDDQYPSAKLLYDIVGNYNTILDEINTLIGG